LYALFLLLRDHLFGFKVSGTVKEAGFKFGRWLDLAFYQNENA
jgi:L-amino acid N-acyltransferase YncA